MKLISLCPFVSLVLTPILAISPVCGQTPLSPTPQVSEAAAPQILQLHLVEGDNSFAQVGSRTVKGFTIQLTDAAGAPVVDAAITFRLPDSSPTGAFADGRHSAVVYTDTAGRANIAGIKWGETPGLVAIRVTATKGTSHAGMLIDQTLTSGTASAASGPALPASSTTLPVQPAVVAPTQPVPAQTVDKTIAPASQDAPVARTSATPDAAPQPERSVSVTSASPGEAPHKSHAKWFIIAAIAAGAGAGVAIAGKGSKSSPSSSVPSLSIGAPSISVGQPH